MRKSIKGYTYPELLVAAGISILLFMAVLGLFVTVKQYYTLNVVEERLQRDADQVIAKVIKGKDEAGSVFRLSDAQSYTLVGINRLDFTGTDGVIRWVTISADGRSVIYHHPVAGAAADEVIYTAPDDVALTLRFWPVLNAVTGLADPLYTNKAIGLDVGLTQTLRGRTFSGSATTLVNIRNHDT